MFKAATFFCLEYTKIITRYSGNLISDPKKLKGMVQVNNTTEFLHKDVVVSIQSKFRTSDELGDDYYGQTFYSNSLGMGDPERYPLFSLYSLAEYFLSRFGVEEFKEFLERNEGMKQKTHTIEQYKGYFKELAMKFNYDRNLMKLVSDCNIHDLVVSNFPDIFNEKENSQEEVFAGNLWNRKITVAKEGFVFNSFSGEEHDRLANDKFNREYERFAISNDNVEVIEEVKRKANKEIIEVTGKSEFAFDIIEDNSESKKIVPLTIDQDEVVTYESLKEMRNQIPKEIYDFFMQNKIMVFTQENTSKKPVSNWVYVQLETGNDELLSAETIDRAMKACGVRNIKKIHIFNGAIKKKQNIVESVVMEKIKTTNKNIVLGKKLEPAKLIKNQEIPKQQAKAKIFERPKAYAFIELHDYSEKMKILNPHFRIFGVNMFGSLLLVDDADIKLTLVLRNADISDIDKFETKFNNELSNNMSDVKIHGYQVYNHIEEKMDAALLRFKTFEDALEVANIMNERIIKKQKLSLDFRRGCGIWDSGEYRELLNDFVAHNATNQKGKKDKKKH